MVALFCHNWTALKLWPSRSRQADARGTDYTRIIPQNTNFIYNNFHRICHCEEEQSDDEAISTLRRDCFDLAVSQ